MPEDEGVHLAPPWSPEATLRTQLAWGTLAAGVLWAAAYLSTRPSPPASEGALRWAQAAGAGFVGLAGLVGAASRRTGDYEEGYAAHGLGWVACVYLQAVAGVALALGPAVAGRDLILGQLHPRGAILAGAGVLGLATVAAALDGNMVPGPVGVAGGVAVSLAVVALTPWFPVAAVMVVGALALARAAHQAGVGAQPEEP